VASSPDSMTVTSSDANLTISGVNLPLVSNSDKKVVVTGTATKAVDASKFIDCSKAYVDFPSLTSSTSW
jgi:polygalacturonase